MSPLGWLSFLLAVLLIVAFFRKGGTSMRSRAQFALALLGCGALWFATASSFAARGMNNLVIHMIGHVLVMFLVPMTFILSAAGRNLLWVLPVNFRRRVMRWFFITRRWHLPKGAIGPVFGAVVLNAVMVCAHLSSPFNFAMQHRWAMDWIMEPAFLLSGLLFFHFILTAPPRKNRGKLRLELFMILSTMLEMLVMAMAMSIFTKSAWYSSMVMNSSMPSMPGMAMTTSAAFHDQQLAAAILWICGDFWAVPCLVLIIRRLIQRDGSLLAALDRQTSRLSTSEA